jgi:ribosomal protein L16 Arg81 hydroxylase
MLTFADVIAPVPLDRFLAETWEQQPLQLRRRTPGFYDPLLTRAQIEAALTSGGLRFPAVQLARDGHFLPPEAFTHTLRSGGDLFTGVPDLARLRAEYQAGATISLPGFHRACAPLARLVAAIEAQFSHAVHTNVYLTPAHAAGFTPHFDTHDVLILQIAGAKHWTIRRPPLPLPHRSQAFNPATTAPTEPIIELDLDPGDLLYLPRGFVHSTTTSALFSIHVTLGITVYTWADLLADWAQSARLAPRCRQALPPGFAAANPGALKPQLAALIAELAASADLDALLSDFCTRARTARRAPQGAFDAAAAPLNPPPAHSRYS